MRVSSFLISVPVGMFLLCAHWGCAGGGSCGCTPAPPPKGSISGRLTTGTGAPLYGIQVQTALIPQAPQDGVNDLSPSTSTTDSDGRFHAAVPVGKFYVYSQPQMGSTSYAIQVSNPVTITDEVVAVTGVDMQFDPAPTSQIDGTITPTATGTRRYFAYLEQKLTLGGSTFTFPLRGTEALMESGANHFHFPLLPEGEYVLTFSWSETNGNSGTKGFAITTVGISLKAGEAQAVQYQFH